MSDIAFKVLIGNGYDDILFKTIMLKGEKGDQGEAGATGIDDSVVASDKTWSSSKIKNEMDSLPKNFSALNDVEINTPQDDQAPLYDATAGKWKNKTVDASTLKYSSTKTIKQQIDDKSVLTGLNDVAISSPQGNQGLVYNATTGKWENGAVSSTSALAQLTDVLLNTPIENLSSLVYDLTSGKWKDKRLKIICTQAQYNAWKNASPSQLIPNTDYLITDAPNLNPTADDIAFDSNNTVKQIINSKQNMIPQGSASNLDANNLYGDNIVKTYRSVGGSIANIPAIDGTLIVVSNGSGFSTTQLFVNFNGELYIRNNWGAGSVSWQDWKSINAYKTSIANNLQFYRKGDVVYFSITSGDFATNSSGIIVIGGSTALIPQGYRPPTNCQMYETNLGVRMSAQADGSIWCARTSSSGLVLRVSGCWVTTDAIPS